MDSVRLEHQGQWYTGRYRETGEYVVVFHHLATKRAKLSGLPAAPLALQLLFEIVAREGRGVADLPLPLPDSDTPA